MTTPQPVLEEKTTREILDKLDGIQLPDIEYKNAPENVESAVERIMVLETALEDLSRAVEIALITKQFNLVEGFRERAEDVLKTKIIVEHPNSGPMKIAIVGSEKNAQGTDSQST